MQKENFSSYSFPRTVYEIFVKSSLFHLFFTPGAVYLKAGGTTVLRFLNHGKSVLVPAGKDVTADGDYSRG